MSNKPWEMFIVLENGKPAVLKNSKVWNRCIFKSIDGAANYAEYWCGRVLEGRDITNHDWVKGVDISQTETPCIVSIDTILVDVPSGITSINR